VIASAPLREQLVSLPALAPRAEVCGPIVRVDRRPCPYASSFRMDELDITFEDRSRLRLMLKDLRRGGLSADARRSRPDFISDPEREIRVYRDVLPAAPAGTAACYGTVREDLPERHWLVLERIDGVELCHVGAFPHWERTAEWIAGFHRTYARGQAAAVAGAAGLLTYDQAFYWRWIERALQFTIRDRAAHSLVTRIANNYGRVISRLVSLPSTLIHGEFYPSNILIGQSADPVRISPVDWEMSALGPGLIDLAALTTGWNEPQRHALLRAYRHALGDAAALDLTDDWLLDLDCCRMHLALRMLGWSDDWSPPPQHAFDWLGEAAHGAARLALLGQ
jgi:hypothetical protein